MFNRVSRPVELYILSFLLGPEVFKISSVNKDAKTRVSDESFWYHRLKSEFGYQISDAQNSKEIFKLSYQAVPEQELMTMYGMALESIDIEAKKLLGSFAMNDTSPAGLTARLNRDNYVKNATENLESVVRHDLSNLKKYLTSQFPNEFKSFSYNRKSEDALTSEQDLKEMFSGEKKEGKSNNADFMLILMCKLDAHFSLKMIVSMLPHILNTKLLGIACFYQRINTIKLFLELNADINKCVVSNIYHTTFEFTPIAYAIINVFIHPELDLAALKDIIKLLLLHGADPTIKIFCSSDDFDEKAIDTRGKSLLEVCEEFKKTAGKESTFINLFHFEKFPDERKKIIFDIVDMIINYRDFQKKQTGSLVAFFNSGAISAQQERIESKSSPAKKAAP